MPVCTVCESDSFHEFDGLFYCAACQTQSQHMQIEEDDNASVPRSFRTAEIISKHMKSDTKDINDFDRGRPWTTVEAFQAILKMQADVIISLGATEIFKDIMFEFWKIYLKNTGQAFCAPIEKCHVKRRRDKHLPTIDYPLVVPLKVRQTSENKSTARVAELKKQVELKLTKAEMVQALGEESFYDGDSPLAEEPVLPSSDSGDADSASVDGEDVYSVDVMQLRLTLAFCFISLLQSGHIVTSSDILRWVHTGKLPYENALSSKPEFVFSNIDTNTFAPKAQCVPDEVTLRRLCHRLMTLIGATSLTLPPLEPLISRCVLRLCLPAEMQGLVMVLYAQAPIVLHIPFGHFKSLPPVETLALAYMVVLLKLMFNLDDFTEAALSNYARELRATGRARQPLFMWDEWVQVMSEHVRGIPRQLPACLDDVMKVTDVTACLAAWEHTWKVPQTVVRVSSKIKKIYRPEVKTDIAEPLKMLLGKLKKEPAPQTHQISAEVTTSQPPVRPRQCLTAGEPSRLHEFPRMTVKYITEALDFLDHMGNHGIAQATLHMMESEAAAPPGEEIIGCPPACDEAEDEVLADNERKTIKRKRAWSSSSDNSAKRYKTTIDAVRKTLLNMQPGNTDADSTEIRSRITELSRYLDVTRNSYVIYHSQCSDLPISFEWLLETCARVADVDVRCLRSIVHTLELTLLVQPDELTHRHKSSIQTTMNMYSFTINRAKL